MLQKEKQRLLKMNHIADLIADSFFDDMYDWTHQENIKCYAFARGLTFPDPENILYSPGKIYHLKFGTGNFVRNEHDPRIIDKYVMRDSLALGQKCERVSFNTIKDNDGNFYFAITNFHMLEHPDVNHWHFICRTPSELWLHKPNRIQSVQNINWIKYGETFEFQTIATELKMQCSKPSSEIKYVSCRGICFENYFYRLELPED